jgi:hypothetical protein
MVGESTTSSVKIPADDCDGSPLFTVTSISISRSLADRLRTVLHTPLPSREQPESG